VTTNAPIPTPSTPPSTPCRGRSKRRWCCT
jgi:hypothetical protein